MIFLLTLFILYGIRNADIEKSLISKDFSINFELKL